MTTVYRSRFIALLACVLALAAGNAACTTQAYDLIDVVPIPIEAPKGHYQDITWLAPEVLAMEYMPTPDTHNVKTGLMILGLDSGESYLLTDEIPSDCFETRYGRNNRLPNGHLGYLWECIPDGSGGRDYRMHEWNPASQNDMELYRYPIPFWATAFSFAPEMDRWLQEQTGDGLFNKLHFVEEGELPVLLLEDSFARAGHPAWLRDGRIIFAGTPQLPESGTNLFSGLPGITSGLAEPWNIYLTDLDSLLNETVSEDQIVLSDIQYIEAVKASPDGQLVSFLGTIDGHTGLWIYNLETSELARLWAGFGPYDWSPDGEEIMMLVRDPEATVFRGQPARIVLPASPTE